MSADTHAALDKAIRDHLTAEWGTDAAIVTHWTLTAAAIDGDGNPRIIGEHVHDEMPTWQIRGLLHEALIQLDVEDD